MHYIQIPKKIIDSVVKTWQCIVSKFIIIILTIIIIIIIIINDDN